MLGDSFSRTHAVFTQFPEIGRISDDGTMASWLPLNIEICANSSPGRILLLCAILRVRTSRLPRTVFCYFRLLLCLSGIFCFHLHYHINIILLCCDIISYYCYYYTYRWSVECGVIHCALRWFLHEVLSILPKQYDWYFSGYKVV